MVRANSLLYAVYICLVVSVVCAALLYYSDIYRQLNQYYNSQEDLFLANQSAVNYALGTMKDTDEITDETGITSVFTTKPYGMLTLMETKTFTASDTVLSMHFIGQYPKNNTCLYLPQFSKPLSYSGHVTLSGISCLPQTGIGQTHIALSENQLHFSGSIAKPDVLLPKLNDRFRDIYKPELAAMQLSAMEKSNDSVYSNSFSLPTLYIDISGINLDRKVIKGNIVLMSSLPVTVNKSAALQDVIIKAPSVVFEPGFEGNLQVFAQENIELGEDAKLGYPSVLCVFNPNSNSASIQVKERAEVSGAVVLFGSDLANISKNNVVFSKESLVVGDVYCEGQADLSGTVYGAVYSNRFVKKTDASLYENCISETEVNAGKRPEYFISIPLFTANVTGYGLLKKVF